MDSTTAATTSNVSFFNSTLDSSMPQYFTLPYQIIGCLLVSSVFLVGLIGNIMVVIVVSRTRTMRSTTNCYLLSLAVADILLLISAPLPTIWEYFIIIDQCIIGNVGCRIMVFCQYLGINVSSLSITAFTVERYIAICHPMRAQTICTIKRAKRIIVCLWAFGIVYCAPWLWLATTKSRTYRDGTTIESCGFTLSRKSYVYTYLADMIIFYGIPLLVTSVLYGLIGRVLMSSEIPATPGKPSMTSHNGNSYCRANPGGSRSSTVSSRVQVRPS